MCMLYSSRSSMHFAVYTIYFTTQIMAQSLSEHDTYRPLNFHKILLPYKLWPSWWLIEEITVCGMCQKKLGIMFFCVLKRNCLQTAIMTYLERAAWNVYGKMCTSQSLFYLYSIFNGFALRVIHLHLLTL